jgi:formamidopyrimidine-DNA glycosylase
VPELPEVETIARDIAPQVAGARIGTVRVHKADVLRNSKAPAFARALEGRRITKLARRAKHLVFLLDDGLRMVIQPRMTGSLSVTKRPTRDPYAVLEFSLDGGRVLTFRDVRRLGAVHLLSPTKWQAYTARIGPEPLERGFTPARMADVLAGGRLAVKKALMDQRRLAGVGNIYANEALWIARIDPSRPAAGLRPAEIARVHRAVVDVLRRAVNGRGTTVRDYRTGTGGPGTFQGRLAVYERAGEPCLRCGRRIALTHAIDQRATYFCPWCQS